MVDSPHLADAARAEARTAASDAAPKSTKKATAHANWSPWCSAGPNVNVRGVVTSSTKVPMDEMVIPWKAAMFLRSRGEDGEDE